MMKIVPIRSTSGITTYEYDDVDRLTKRTLPNGIITDYTYDLRDRLDTLSHSKGGVVIASFDYDRTASGEPTRIDNEDGSRIDVVYDAAQRVQSETQVDAGGAASDERSYSYDADGKRTSRTVNGVVESHTHAAAHKLLTVMIGAALSMGFTHDGAGRVTGIERDAIDYTLSYDADGHITSVDDGAVPKAQYVFDGEQRREQVIHDGVTRKYLVAPAMGSGLDVPEAVVDETNALVASYVYVGDRPLMRIDASGTPTYYLEDAIQSVVATANSAGSITDTFRYDSFGNELPGSGALPSDTLGDFRFQGMWKDLTGLYFVRARHYDAETGQFLSRDPAEGQLAAPESFAFYAFANHNPWVYSDPTGEFSLSELAVKVQTEFALASTALSGGSGLLVLRNLRAFRDTGLSAIRAIPSLLRNTRVVPKTIFKLDPHMIRFSQNSVSRLFGDKTTSLGSVIRGLRSGRINPSSIPPIRVTTLRGRLFTIDNRRLLVFKEANLPIRVVHATRDEVIEAIAKGKFSTVTEGLIVRVRGGGL